MCSIFTSCEKAKSNGEDVEKDENSNLIDSEHVFLALQTVRGERNKSRKMILRQKNNQ